MNKEELLRAMEHRFTEEYAAMHRQFQSEAPSLPFDRALESLVRRLFRFYYDNPYYYVFFLIQMLKVPFSSQPEVRVLMKEQLRIFRNFFRGLFGEETAEESHDRLHYFYVATTFWFSPHFIDETSGKAKMPRLTAGEGRRCRGGNLPPLPRRGPAGEARGPDRFRTRRGRFSHQARGGAPEGTGSSRPSRKS